jgi:hypothetical protein
VDIDRHLVSTIKRTDVVGFGLVPLLDHITIGFDQSQGHIPRFLVLLHYQTSKSPGNWTEIARMDHNETPNQGHDVYQEGLHVDIARRSERAVHLQIRHGPLPSNRGVVLRACVEYLRDEAEYFIDVYEDRRSPGGPPRWSPDGGEPIHTLVNVDPIATDMNRKAPPEDEALSPEELSGALAEATNSSSEEIEGGAEEFEIAPPEEAEIVGYGGHGPLTDPDDHRHD